MAAGHSHRFDTDLSSLAGYVIDRCISICACVPSPIHELPLPSLALLAKRLEQKPLR
jgi:hypothetical protein